jgi:virulence-associated protein VagC
VKTTKLFRSGGSYAVRIPKAWVPESRKVVLRREGKRIVISEAGSDLRALAQNFAKDGLIDFKRPEQPQTPPSKLM